MRFKDILLVISAISILFITSCTDVGRRPKSEACLEKLAIPIFKNRTNQPDIENIITQKLVQDFLVDGRMGIVDKEEANIVLQGTVVKYILEPLLFDINDTPQQYKLRIILRIALKNVKAGKTLWSEDNFEESTTYYVDNDRGITPEDEATARGRVVESLTQKILRRVIEEF